MSRRSSASRSPRNCAVNCSSSTMHSAIAGRYGAPRIGSTHAGAHLQIIDGDVTVRDSGEIDSKSGVSITSAHQTVLEGFETGFQELGNDGPHDNGGLAVSTILHAPLN